MALIHPKWNLSGFSRVESDYWEVKTPTGAEEVERTRTPPAEGAGETRATDASTEENVVVVDNDPSA